MLELLNVKKIYVTKAGLTYALNGVSLNFEEKGLVFIAGQSGSGKTTMLNVIGGLDGIEEGEIVVNGRELSSLTDKEYDAYRNTFVGFIFQEYNLLPDYTVEKNICIANELQGIETDKEYLKQLLEKVGIAGLEKRMPSQLSGGQKQRVAIARALIKNPSIIMADEPTGALDSATGTQVITMLKELSKEKLVIVVSHDMELAEKYADRIIRIKDGKVESDTILTDKQLIGNVYENKTTFTVKSRSKLSSDEQLALAKAIETGKEVEIKDTVIVREKAETPNIKSVRPQNPAKFINSKMKLKSSFELGVKSLKVKPLRLIFTILLSAIAFAVFGLFDTIAAFSKSKIAEDIIKNGEYSSISISADYTSSISNKTTKFSLDDSFMQEISQNSGYEFRPIYTFNAEKNNNISIVADTVAGGPLFNKKENESGDLYYSNAVNGYVEFDAETEVTGEYGNWTLDKDGYNLKILKGTYPKNTDGYVNTYSIGISSYLADSLTHFYSGSATTEGDYSFVFGKEITFNKRTFKIDCIIDCGKIPEKYKALAYSNRDNVDGLLQQDFTTFINSGLYLNVFVAKGYHEEYAKQHNKVNYYFSDSSYKATSGNYTGNLDNRFYLANSIPNKNVYYFRERNNSGIRADEYAILQENEALINIWDFYRFYKNNYRRQEDIDQMAKDVAQIIKNGSNYDNVRNLFNSMLGYSYSKEFEKTCSILKLKPPATFYSDTEYFKIVGVYFDINNDEYDTTNLDSKTITSNLNLYPLATTDVIFDKFDIYKNQGDYSRIVAPLHSGENTTAITSYLDSNDAVSYKWFKNTVLETLTENEDVIGQVSNLFLYVAIILALFSIFMLFNYISVSIVSKRQSIGVLRALGSNSKDIFRMFISESAIIALINSILAVIISFVGCIFVNMYVKKVMMISANFALYGLRQVIVISLLCFATAILSSIIPIMKICKEKPVKLIREP